MLDRIIPYVKKLAYLLAKCQVEAILIHTSAGSFQVQQSGFGKGRSIVEMA